MSRKLLKLCATGSTNPDTARHTCPPGCKSQRGKYQPNRLTLVVQPTVRVLGPSKRVLCDARHATVPQRDEVVDRSAYSFPIAWVRQVIF
jgi:hypothetical protein